MLVFEAIPTETLHTEAFRYARQPIAASELLQTLGVDTADPTLGEWLRENGWVETPRRLCALTFKRRLQKTKERPRSRFSDSSFPVLYSSLDLQTAEAELRHKVSDSKYWGRPKKLRTYCYSKFRLDFRGRVKDLRDHSAACPELTSDDYAYCNKIGALAVKIGLYGLLVPSARRHGGTNLPIFDERAVSNPREDQLVSVTYDPETSEVVLRGI